MLEQIKNTTEYIKRIIGDFQPEIGIILGTGLGGLVQEMEVKYELLYSMIPNFPHRLQSNLPERMGRQLQTTNIQPCGHSLPREPVRFLSPVQGWNRARGPQF
jgi:purine nucleoside phosphorylase